MHDLSLSIISQTIIPITMKTPGINSTHPLVFVSLLIVASCLLCPAHSQDYRDFLQCLNNSSVSGVVYTPNNSSYQPILISTVQNLRFASPSTPKPLVIVRPVHESQIQAVVFCSKEYQIQIRTRSGGHDFEGLSYTSRRSRVPFVVIDMINLSEITIDVERKTAWAGAGATLEQLYSRISNVSGTLAFPAGFCPTVGLGGYMGGGGYGPLLRKYGLAADNTIDARLIDVNGRILDRKSMGEELFWAIRGGGAASFGVIIAWKVKLVSIPALVTVCSVTRTLQQNATELLHKWQYVAPSLPKEVYFATMMRRVNNSNKTGEKILQASFSPMFLGGVNKLLRLFEQRFPELGMKRADCFEVSLLPFLISASENPGNDFYENVAPFEKSYFKAKSDYVQEPISIFGLKGIWNFLYENEAETSQVVFISYGGRMNEISESALPFPHRAGNLYKVRYLVGWGAGIETPQRYINWIRKLYRYMGSYVSKSPRAAYFGYRDLDLGVNNKGNTSYEQASIWGYKYFKNNFNRLVGVKTMVDPANFFRDEQSIPPFYS